MKRLTQPIPALGRLLPRCNVKGSILEWSGLCQKSKTFSKGFFTSFLECWSWSFVPFFVRNELMHQGGAVWFHHQKRKSNEHHMHVAKTWICDICNVCMIPNLSIIDICRVWQHRCRMRNLARHELSSNSQGRVLNKSARSVSIRCSIIYIYIYMHLLYIIYIPSSKYTCIWDFWRVSQMFKAFHAVKHLKKHQFWVRPESISHELLKKQAFNYLPTTLFWAEMISFSKIAQGSKGPRVKTFHLEHAPLTSAAMEHEIWLLSLQWPRSPQVRWTEGAQVIQTGHPSTYFRQRNTSLKNPNPCLEWYWGSNPIVRISQDSPGFLA